MSNKKDAIGLYELRPTQVSTVQSGQCDDNQKQAYFHIL